MVLANPIYIRSIYGLVGREVTEYTVIYGVYVCLHNAGPPYSSTLAISCKGLVVVGSNVNKVSYK